MTTYQATTPPQDATCDSAACCSTAAVHLIVPKSRFSADGIDHDADPPAFDCCDLHWPGIRDACIRNGHQVVDITGNVGELVRDFPGWTIFRSDGGRLYASAPVSGTGQGMTLDAWLVGPLRAQMSAAHVGAR